jgi:hypothetical protein
LLTPSSVTSAAIGGATTITSSTAATTALRTPEAGALRPSFTYGEPSALKGLAVQSRHRLLDVLAFGEFDKPESARLTCHFVSDHHRRSHLETSVRHEIAQPSVRRAVG